MRTLTAPTLALLALHAAPAVGAPAVAVDVAGGWAITSYRHDHDSTLSGPALNVALGAEWQTGRVTVGAVAGLLAAPSIDQSFGLGAGSVRDRLLVPHAGAFLSLPLARAPVTLGARLELACGWLTGPILVQDARPITDTLSAVFGGLASVTGSYDLALATAQRLSIGLDATAGWLGRPSAHMTPLALLAFVGVRWD
ncbi:MAG TPA: hypothetical protein VHL80_03170 [Polyangia bacterium]|nr:hypothetical protein [Polyangia bacterium]